jgi:hypothetical protein
MKFTTDSTGLARVKKPINLIYVQEKNLLGWINESSQPFFYHRKIIIAL